MADLHNPYVGNITFNAADNPSTHARITYSEPLSEGTTFHLLGANINATLGKANNILYSLDNVTARVNGENRNVPCGIRTVE